MRTLLLREGGETQIYGEGFHSKLVLKFDQMAMCV